MKKADLWNRRLSLKAGSILLTAALVAGSCSAAVMAADSTGETAEAAASGASSTVEAAASGASSTVEAAASGASSTAETAASGASSTAEAAASEAVSGAESADEAGDDSYELLTDEEAAELALGSDEAGEEGDVLDMSDFAYELSPEGEEMQEYVEENYTPDLVNTYGSIRYDQVVWNEKGEETDETGYIYRDKDLIISEFIDGYKEIIDKDRFDGYDSTADAPVRYVFDSEDTRSEVLMNYDELFFLWGAEEVSAKREEGDEVIFTSGLDDFEMISYSMPSYNGDIEEGDVLERETVFDSKTRLLKKSTVNLVKKDGTKNKVFECTLTTAPENGYTLDEELLAKLDSDDSHSFTLVLEPGTEIEEKIEAKAGKGCMFYPVIYDGYTYYTDKECTVEAEQEVLQEKEKDIVLYGKMPEIYDDDMEIDAGEYVIDADNMDNLDLSELFSVEGLEEEDSAAEAGAEANSSAAAVSGEEIVGEVVG